MQSIHQNIRKTVLQWIDFFYKPFKQYIPLHTFRYAVCGGTNTLFDICMFTLSYHFIFKQHNFNLGFVTLSAPVASLFFAMCFSLPTGFYLNRYVVFQQTGLKAHNQLIRFVTVTVVCIFLNYIFLKIFVEKLGIYPTPAKVLTTILVIIFSYTSQTHILFKAREY